MRTQQKPSLNLLYGPNSKLETQTRLSLICAQTASTRRQEHNIILRVWLVLEITRRCEATRPSLTRNRRPTFVRWCEAVTDDLARFAGFGERSRSRPLTTRPRPSPAQDSLRPSLACILPLRAPCLTTLGHGRWPPLEGPNSADASPSWVVRANIWLSDPKFGRSGPNLVVRTPTLVDAGPNSFSQAQHGCSDRNVRPASRWLRMSPSPQVDMTRALRPRMRHHRAIIERQAHFVVSDDVAPSPSRGAGSRGIRSEVLSAQRCCRPHNAFDADDEAIGGASTCPFGARNESSPPSLAFLFKRKRALVDPNQVW